jgi:hypothetical protein
MGKANKPPKRREKRKTPNHDTHSRWHDVGKALLWFAVVAVPAYLGAAATAPKMSVKIAGRGTETSSFELRNTGSMPAYDVRVICQFNDVQYGRMLILNSASSLRYTYEKFDPEGGKEEFCGPLIDDPSLDHADVEIEIEYRPFYLWPCRSLARSRFIVIRDNTGVRRWSEAVPGERKVGLRWWEHACKVLS